MEAGMAEKRGPTKRAPGLASAWDGRAAPAVTLYAIESRIELFRLDLEAIGLRFRKARSQAEIDTLVGALARELNYPHAKRYWQGIARFAANRKWITPVTGSSWLI